MEQICRRASLNLYQDNLANYKWIKTHHFTLSACMNSLNNNSDSPLFSPWAVFSCSCPLHVFVLLRSSFRGLAWASKRQVLKIPQQQADDTQISVNNTDGKCFDHFLFVSYPCVYVQRLHHYMLQASFFKLIKSVLKKGFIDWWSEYISDKLWYAFPDSVNYKNSIILKYYIKNDSCSFK